MLQYPERIFNAPSGITSVGFSQNHPNLLAVSDTFNEVSKKCFLNLYTCISQAGLYNGVVVLFNVRGSAHESVLDSRYNILQCMYVHVCIT